VKSGIDDNLNKEEESCQSCAQRME